MADDAARRLVTFTEFHITLVIYYLKKELKVQGGSNMTGTDCV